jgi:hypothetical protein
MTNVIEAHDVLAVEQIELVQEQQQLAVVVDHPARTRLLDLLSVVQLLTASLAQATRRAKAAEHEVERLTARLGELETWIDERSAFDEVETLQIGRLLAAAEARRIERLARPLVSIRTVLLLIYSAALVCLAALILFDRIL